MANSVPKLTREQISDLKAMIGDGVPRAEIAEAFGVTTSTVTYHAIRAGFATRGEAHVGATSVDNDIADAAMFRPRDWLDRALCAQVDPDLFFPQKGADTRRPKSICATCSVQVECLDDALANNERHGIWGGVSERDRRKIQRFLTNTNTEHQESA